MATPHDFRTHAPDQFRIDPLPSGRVRSLRSGLLIGATSVALTFTVLPGTAVADPTEATTPEQATQLVAQASHELEVVTEELNTAKVELEEQQAAVAAAESMWTSATMYTLRWPDVPRATLAVRSRMASTPCSRAPSPR